MRPLITPRALIVSLLAVAWSMPGAPQPAAGQAGGAYVVADTWASLTATLPAGSFRQAAGIDMAPGGRILVADAAEPRVTIITPDGPDGPAVLTPLSGLVSPAHLALDAARDRLYVADPGQDAVVVARLDGTPVANWPGVPGAAGLGVAPDGTVHVAAADTGDVHRFAPDGSPLPPWSAVPTVPGGGLLAGLDVDAEGRTVVVDGRAPRLHVLDTAGRRIDTLRLDSVGDLRDVVVDFEPGVTTRRLYWLATSRGLAVYDTRSAVPTLNAWGPMSAVAIDPDPVRDAGLAVTFLGFGASPSQVLRFPYREARNGAPDRRWGGTLSGPGVLDGPARLAVGADGRAWVIDRGARVQRYALDGQPLSELPHGRPLAADAGPDGTLYVADGDRVSAHDSAGARVWDAPVGAGPDTSFARELVWDAGAGEVVVLDTTAQSLRRYAADGTPGRVTRLADPVAPGSWSDVATDGTGTVYVLDRSGPWWIAVAPDGSSVASAALGAEPRRIAVAPGGGRVFTLARDGWVRIYDAAGISSGAFDATRFDLGTSSVPSDLAVDTAGDVYVTDRDADAITRFTWDPAATPVEPPIDGPGCTEFPDKTAIPGEIELGETVDVRLTVRGGCPPGLTTDELDVMLIIDRSGSMIGQKMQIAREAAFDFVQEIDLATSRVGVVSFDHAATVDLGLSDVEGQLWRAIQGLTAGGGTRIDLGLEAATDEWLRRRRPGARAVFILLSDGGSNRASALAEARRAKSLGVELFTIGIQADQALMRDIATDPGHYFPATNARFLYGVFDAIARRITTAVLYRTITVTDRVPANMRYVPGSAVPPATFDGATNTLTWTLADVPFNGFSLRYRLEPTEVGQWPTNIAAWGDFVDGLDKAGRVDFPVPRVLVRAPQVEPTPTTGPSATATPRPTNTPGPTDTPEATPTPAPPVPIFLPVAISEQCVPGQRHADVVLVMDTSGSMAGAKLDAAKAAARQFVGLLDLGADQIGVVAFATEARLAAPLAGDAPAAVRAIDGLEPSPGTFVDRGLLTARDELAGPRRRAANLPVIVLLTDGIAADPAAARAAAADLRTRDVRLYAVGLGADVDFPFLVELAGPDRAFLAPGPEDLARIYAEIAVLIPCDPADFWP